MPIEQLPIQCFYEKQRYTQFGSQDCANWYMVEAPTGKKQVAMYPAMGRQHIKFLNQTKLVFDLEPRYIFRSIDYIYVFVGIEIYRFDRFYNKVTLTNPDYNSLTGDIWAAYLVVNNYVYIMFSAPTSTGRKLFVINEGDGNQPAVTTVTDPFAPQNPMYVAAFGSRFVVSEQHSKEFRLSTINLDGDNFDASTCFTILNAPLLAQASGRIGQFAVLHAQLYIFCEFSTDVWANIPSQFLGVTFPWKLNTSYNFDYGIADDKSLDVDFGRMVWLAQNRNGLVTFMTSTGQEPQSISTQAINVLLEQGAVDRRISSFVTNVTHGFLYQWENTVFYRVSSGRYLDFGQLDMEVDANCIEYNFDTNTWHRCIELNGERNRSERHVFFNNKHLITVQGEAALYELSGYVYHNELRNPEQPDIHADDAFLRYPMRYELVTRQIYNEDYSEFMTEWVQIDFVFGHKTFYKSLAPFANTEFIIAEESDEEGEPIFLVTEDDSTFLVTESTNTPEFDDNHYNALFKPHIELYVSDDGGVTFYSADLREFSRLGEYQWRMRWYELGCSRNRCYKLVCVSSVPIVILGGIQKRETVSDGAY